MYVVCSQAARSAITAEDAEYKAGETVHRLRQVHHQRFNSPGFLTAYDLTTGKIAWQKESRNPATPAR